MNKNIFEATKLRTGATVFKNPSVSTLLSVSKGKIFRGLIDYTTGDTFWWDGEYEIHDLAARELGIEYYEQLELNNANNRQVTWISALYIPIIKFSEKKSHIYRKMLNSASFRHLISTDRLRFHDYGLNRDIGVSEMSQIANGKMLSEQKILERADINSDAFRSWFAGSKVVDRNGPRVCYHGTTPARELLIKNFRPFTHFGTLTAASSILYSSAKSGPGEGRLNKAEQEQYLKNRSVIYPVYLRIRNPILFKDSGMQHDPSDFLKIAAFGTDHGPAELYYKKDTLFYQRIIQLVKQIGVMNYEEYKKLREYFDTHQNYIAQYKKLANFLLKKGYDGFAYKNTYEHKNTFSWVILSPDQVWPLYINDPKKIHP